MPRFLVVIALLFAGGQALAQDVFTVPQVPVYAEAESSAEAKEQARLKGRQAAMDILLRRLVAENDWIYLPRLAAGEEAEAYEQAYGGFVEPEPDAAYDPDAAYSPARERQQQMEREREFSAMPPVGKQPIVIDEQGLAQLEESVDIFNEKSSASTYRANITFRFKPDAVRALLQNARLPYSEEQARRVMVLPVLQTAKGVYLWEAKNPWARAWLERPLTNELTPMVLPAGDMVDVQAITAEEARELNAPALRAFMERYDVEELFVALGRLGEQDGDFRLYVRLIDATPPAVDGGPGTTSAIGTTVTEAFFRGSDDDFPALARRAVEATVQRHARQWKRQTLVDYAQEREFQLTAWYESQQEWAEIRQAISTSPLVQKQQTGVFNSENAIMQLTVVGEEQQFRLAMQQRGLEVWQDTSGRWHIADSALASRLKQRLEPLTTDIDDQAERRRGLGRFFGGGRDRREEPRDEIQSDDDIPELPDDLFGDEEGADGGN